MSARSHPKRRGQKCWDGKENASNLGRGLLALPAELTTEILDHFPTIGPYAAVTCDERQECVLSASELYMVRINILRSLSQVCIDYRRAFLPLLWNSLNLSLMRYASLGWTTSLYKHLHQAPVPKCNSDDLSVNANLASYIGTVRIIIRKTVTRYQSAAVIPAFSAFLSSLQNLHTLHILHAHFQMTIPIKHGFQGVVLPRIRTLIIPEDCHEILKCCSQVTQVWCNNGYGHQLAMGIAIHCKEVREIRGFSAKKEVVERIIEAAPNLRVLDMDDRNFQPILDALPSFKNINTIIIKASHSETVDECVKATKQRLKDLEPSKERRYIRVWHPSNDCSLYYYYRRVRKNYDISEYVGGYYTEIPVY